ncbi:unnamed protein product, partial [Ixodes persulcatus]
MAASVRVNSVLSKVLKSFFTSHARLVSTGPHQTSSTAEALRDHYTNFGYKKVAEHEKTEKGNLILCAVREVFDSVADNYDLMNDVMSAGIHRLWKDRLISVLGPLPGMQLIDVAGGTGDVSIRFLNAARYQELQAESSFPPESEGSAREVARAHVVDINREMLSAGKRSKGHIYP